MREETNDALLYYTWEVKVFQTTTVQGKEKFRREKYLKISLGVLIMDKVRICKMTAKKNAGYIMLRKVSHQQNRERKAPFLITKELPYPD